MGAATTTTATATATAVRPERSDKDLTVNKLVAGAGAAATSAVCGSFFGEMGTVTGAAIGSLFSAVVTALYERSLDTTRDTVKARIKLPGGRTVDVAGTTEVPAPYVADGGETGKARVYVTPADRPTEVMSAVPATDEPAAAPPRSRRRLLVLAGFAVVVFALGMLAITGVELIKGSPLNASSSSSGHSGGTSLGGVLTGNSSRTGANTGSSDESATSSAEPTAENSRSARSTAGDDARTGPTAARGGAGADDSEPSSAPSVRVTPTVEPQGASGGGEANAQSGGGAQTRQPQ
jgi:hypothetical protein